jgi:hypothetical protein
MALYWANLHRGVCLKEMEHDAEVVAELADLIQRTTRLKEKLGKESKDG